MNNNMHWEIITKNDILISEQGSSFLKDSKDIKACYFTDGKLTCGVDNKLNFFVNKIMFDLKLKQKINSFFQFKTAKYNLFTNRQEISYNIGINTEDDKYTYKYTMVIFNGKVDLMAVKKENDLIIESKCITLK